MGMKTRGGSQTNPGSRSAPKGQGRAPNIIVPGQQAGPMEPIVLDSNTRAVPEVRGASSSDVKQFSETEPLAEQGLVNSIAEAIRVEKIVAARNKKLGRLTYLCPFCKQAFDIAPKTKKEKPGPASFKACAEHIKKEHLMKVKESKMTKQSKSMREPRPNMVTPPINPADLVAPEHRRFYEGMEQTRREHRGIRAEAVSMRHGRLGGHFSVNQYMAQTEQVCINGLGNLSDKQLADVAQAANNKGKRMLARAAQKMIRNRTVLAAG